MQKKLTITLEQDIYNALHAVVGRGRISQFIATLVRPHVCQLELEASYQRLAEEEKKTKESQEWVDGTSSDFGSLLDEAW